MTDGTTNSIRLKEMQWVRSKDGILAGVCAGLGKQLDVNPWVVRLLWLGAVLLLGTGVLFYLILAWTLPREDRLEKAYESRFLGVCKRISQQTGLDIGLVRALTVILGLFSFGATMVGYIVLYFVLPEQNQVINVKYLEKTSAIRMS